MVAMLSATTAFSGPRLWNATHTVTPVSTISVPKMPK